MCESEVASDSFVIYDNIIWPGEFAYMVNKIKMT